MVTTSKRPSSIYRVIFLSVNGSNIYEVYAQHVCESELFGFVEVGDFVFSSPSAVVLDPSEERLKNEFAGVKRTLIPLQSIFRIDQVQKEGVAKIRDASKSKGNNVSFFPGSGHLRKSERSDSTHD